MLESHQNLLISGQNALNVADWPAAKNYFEAVLQAIDSPAAHDGLGIALWWLNEIDAAHQHRITAYVQYKQNGELGRAVVIAAWLAREQLFLHGQVSAMKGWLARGERLLSQLGSGSERGWFRIFQASLYAPPEQLEHVATETINIAQEYNDPDLEAFALAFHGMAQVSLGRVEAGLTNLDEAMTAAISGEVRNYMVISEIFCVMLSACALAGDLARTEHWVQVATEFAQHHHCSFLSAYCRTTYGGLLTAIGRWPEAETVLSEAIRAFEQGHRALRVHAVLKLADLRVHQGKLEEAEILLTGFEDHPAAALPLARLYLNQGDVQLARATLEQTVQTLSPSSLDRIPLLTLLVDVQVVIGDIESAIATIEEVATLAQQTGSDLLLAQAELVRGQVKACLNQPEALQCFQLVLERLRAYEQSLLVSRARLGMARVLKQQDWAGAVIWARAALASFERAGAVHEANEAAQFLRELGVSGRINQRSTEPLTQRESEVLALVAQGLTNRQIAARLVISTKTAEHHVSQILGKLGLRSRAEAAAYAVRRDTNLSS